MTPSLMAPQAGSCSVDLRVQLEVHNKAVCTGEVRHSRAAFLKSSEKRTKEKKKASEFTLKDCSSRILNRMSIGGEPISKVHRK